MQGKKNGRADQGKRQEAGTALKSGQPRIPEYREEYDYESSSGTRCKQVIAASLASAPVLG